MKDKLKEKGMQQLRRFKRVIAMVLAVLLTVNMVNVVPLDVQAAPRETADVNVSFKVSGSALIAEDDTLKVSVGTVVPEKEVQLDSNNEFTLENVTLEEGVETSYTISSSRYAKPITGNITRESTDPIIVNEGNPLDFDTENSGENDILKVTVTGYVKDSSDQPISGAAMTVVYADAEGQTITVAATDQEGKYSFDANVQRSINIQAEKLGFDKNETPVNVVTKSKTEGDVTANDVVLSKTKIRLNSSAGDNGTIAPAGEVDVDYGDDKEFTVTANAGYYVQSVTQNNEPVSLENGVLKLQNITEASSIQAAFAPKLAFDGSVDITPDTWTNENVVIAGKVKYEGGLEGTDITVSCYDESGALIEETSTINADGSFVIEIPAGSTVLSNNLNITGTLKAKDNANNVEVTYGTAGTIQIDTVLPTIHSVTPVAENENAAVVGETTWVRDGAAFAVVADDKDANQTEGSGIKEITTQLGEDETTKKTITNNLNQIILNTEKKSGNDLSVWATDTVGNESQKYQVPNVKVDNTAPVYTNPAVEEWYSPNENIVIANGFTDENGSGIKTIKACYYNENGILGEEEAVVDWTDSTITLNQEKISLENNNYKCVLVAYDNVGNKCKSTDITLSVDRVKPTFTAEYNTTGTILEKVLKKFGFIKNESVEIKITATDKGLGFEKGKNLIQLKYNSDELKIKKDTESIDEKGNLVATFTLTCPTKDPTTLYTINTIIKDKVGNISDTNVIPAMKDGDQNGFLLENDKPVFSVNVSNAGTVDTTDSNEPWADKDTTVTFEYTIQDEGAGIFDVEAVINGVKYDAAKLAEIDSLDKNKPTYGKDAIEDGTALRVQNAVTYTFVLNKDSELLNSEGRFNVESFVVTDNAGNVREFNKDDADTGSLYAVATNHTIGFDKTAPEIVAGSQNIEGSHATDEDDHSKVWLNDSATATYQYTITDKQSGIMTDEISAWIAGGTDNKLLSTEVKNIEYKEGSDNKIITSCTYEVVVSKDQAIDGNAEISFSVYDNCKNASKYESSEDDNENAKIWFDTTKPDITLKAAPIYKNGTEAPLYAVDGDNAQLTWLNKNTSAIYTFAIEDKESGVDVKSIEILKKTDGADITGKVKKVIYRDKTEAQNPVTFEEKTIEYIEYEVTVAYSNDVNLNGFFELKTADRVANDFTYDFTANEANNIRVKYDVTAPGSDNIKITVQPESYIYKYGVFRNDYYDILVDVRATDSESGVGLETNIRNKKAIKFEFANDEYIGEFKEDGLAVFHIPVKEQIPLSGTLNLTLTDRVDNESQAYQVLYKYVIGGENQSPLEFMIENIAPTANVIKEKTTHDKEPAYVDKNREGRTWYNKAATVTQHFKVVDNESGLNTVNFKLSNEANKDNTLVSINGNERVIQDNIINDQNAKASEDKFVSAEYSIPITVNDAATDGHVYVLSDAKDNAGNVMAQYTTCGTDEVWYDINQPTITRSEPILTEHNTTDLVDPTQIWLDKDATATYTYTIEDTESGINMDRVKINVGTHQGDAVATLKTITYEGKGLTNFKEGMSIKADEKVIACTYEVVVKYADAETEGANKGKANVSLEVYDNVNNGNSTGENTWFDVTTPTFAYQVLPSETIKSRFYTEAGYTGIYSNEAMIIEVTANDTESGLDVGNACIKAFYDGDPLTVYKDSYTKEPVKGQDGNVNNATCQFIIPVSNTQFYDKALTFTINDRVYNTLENVTAAGDKALYMAETLPSVITENKTARTFTDNNGTTHHYYTDDTQAKVWCNAATTATYQYTITDNNSGLNSVSFYINGKEQKDLKPISVTYSNNEKITGSTTEVANPGALIETLSTKKIVSATYNVPVKITDSDSVTGEAKITIGVVDNAGNAASYDAANKGAEIYFDDTMPTIPVESFTFSTGTVLDDAAVHVYRGSNGEGVEFGFFAQTATTVNFNVQDYARNTQGPAFGSGVKMVQYKLDSFYGEDTTGNVSYDRATGNCSFVVPQNFKGTIYVSATDRVENQSGDRYPNGIVIEDMNIHNGATGATITLPETGYHDAEGLPLYTGPVAVALNGYDTHSGIRNATYTYQGFYGALNKFDTTYINSWNADGSYAGTSGEDGIGLNETYEKNTNLISNVSAVQTVSDNVNNISANFNLEDRTGYKAIADEKKFSIDTTAPVIDIQWDNNDVQNEKYYKADRTATVTVTERNFNPDACNFVTTGATPAISGWSHVAGGTCNGSVHTDECKYVATITFSQDSDYTFTFNTTDLAGHRTDFGQTFDFVVDKTAPIINVSYDNNSAMNGMYYKAARTGTISITEHNFRGSDVQTTITSNTSVPGVNGWSSSNDINTATVSYAVDGDYNFNVAYTDLAGNPAAAYAGDRFIIDLTNPTLDIYDIIDKSANNDVVAPGVRYSDTNVDINGVSIALKGANHGAYSLDSASKTQNGNGVDLKMSDFPREQKVDDLYTMTATVSDLAGNQVEKKVMFSVNRFGSVYTLSTDTQKLVDEKYTNEEQKVVVTETNVDTLEEKDVTVTRDGELTRLTDQSDYKVKASGDDTSWKQYTYTIDKANFEAEGNYTVSFSSKDRAANSQDNKVKETPVEFVIDKTAPTAVISGVENNKQYRSNSRNVSVNADDNISLSKVIVTLDGEKKQYSANELDSNNGVLSLTVGSSNTWQTLSVQTVDAAGNTTDTDEIRFLITTNLFIQYVSNKPILFSSMGGVVVIIGGVAYFISRRRRSIGNAHQTPGNGAAGQK